MNMKQLRQVALVVALAATAIIGPSGAANAGKPVAQGSAKVALSDHAGIMNCSNGESGSYNPTLVAPVGGFVVFNYSDYMNTVRATVSFKGAQNTYYWVRFIQATPNPFAAWWECHVTDGFFMTNGRGNGNITLEQLKHPFAQALQVWISASPIYFGSPELIAADEPFALPVPIS